MRDALTFGVVWSFAIAASIALPMTAVIVRAVVSGRETEEERRSRRLYRLLLEEEIHGGEHCFSCRGRVEPEWLRCPACETELHQRCECGALLELYWSACPWCTRPTAGLERPPERENVPVAAPDRAAAA